MILFYTLVGFAVGLSLGFSGLATERAILLGVLWPVFAYVLGKRLGAGETFERFEKWLGLGLAAPTQKIHLHKILVTEDPAQFVAGLVQAAVGRETRAGGL